ncbi:ArsA family ATPase [Segeticoccus rhizosphaerae]|uniref:ArsA family ATPase n=3 Tax=Segeticoccus rhizosphaerae TaxID=1104777 RepID=UPI0010BFF70D|nr:ArsA family ATPase [Ornithinicoccus soli]
MRVILFTGKGGVGKTTTAAATAVRAARDGVKTLVMSTDPAHSIGDALEIGLDGPESPTQVEPGLFAMHVDAERVARESWRGVQAYLVRVLDGLGMDPVMAEEVASLPGAPEVVALLELREQVVSGPWDLVVVDCAPTAETLRLLSLPEALAWHLERLAPASRGFWRALRPAAAAAAGVPLPDHQLVDLVRDWQVRLRDVQELLTSPTTSVRLVLTPEKVVIAEARRMLTSLRLHGLAVDQVVVNRLFPDPADDAVPGDPWRSGWHRAQREGLARVHESFDPIPVLTSAYLEAEPVGVEALARLSAAHGPGIDLLQVPDVEGMTVRPSQGGFILTLPLPLVTAERVDLGRRQGELLISVDGHRRVLSLPSALRRCVATGAKVRDGRLRIRFVPDEEVWPRGS